MVFAKNLIYQKRHAAALILAMIFVLVFSAMAISIAAISGTNVELADNQHKVNSSLCAALSGLEVMRYYISDLTISGTVPPANRLQAVGTALQDDLTEAGVTNITTNYDNGTKTLTVAGVPLDTQSNQTFSVTVTQLDDDTLQMHITGNNRQIRRTIAVQFEFDTLGHRIFDYGVATKGPLSLLGNIELGGINVAIESSVYIESNNDTALSIIGNSQIAGDVSITNGRDAAEIVDLQGDKASIGGETGSAAIENHVTTSVPPTEFPVPTPEYFDQYVVETIDPETYQTQTTFENIRIPANTNPSFSSGATLKGVVFIEQPNVVTFTGNVNITGVIVGNGQVDDDSELNRIRFLGNVNSRCVSELPAESQFDQLRDDTGIFIIAPGFRVALGGNFSTLNGTIAANGINFFGNAGGIIDGTIINYAQRAMYMAGNSDLYFNRTGATQVPAGFLQDQVLTFQPESYSEVQL